MVQSVELILDEAAEAEVRRQWRSLANAGIHSPAPDHRPHITAAVAREVWPRLDRPLAALSLPPLPVRLGGLLVFGARRLVLVRLVVPTAELLALQRDVAEVVAGCPGIPATTRPGAWTPHVTLARRLQPGQIETAIDAVAADRDSAATVVGIRRWDGDRRTERLIARGSGVHDRPADAGPAEDMHSIPRCTADNDTRGTHGHPDPDITEFRRDRHR
ncbi:2'-5' RNA ligase family protein [Nocardia vermiculata]|uniref:2'-5' RNA ligase family protein n=1 Tax=Nocardia vermiculata TaxID=257274 RepID=A0A846Y4R6_9NOCA|nr:2'-5' RNA ligase family protein [Nocardia vermiculata]